MLIQSNDHFNCTICDDTFKIHNNLSIHTIALHMEKRDHSTALTTKPDPTPTLFQPNPFFNTNSTQIQPEPDPILTQFKLIQTQTKSKPNPNKTLTQPLPNLNTNSTQTLASSNTNQAQNQLKPSPK